MRAFIYAAWAAVLVSCAATYRGDVSAPRAFTGLRSVYFDAALHTAGIEVTEAERMLMDARIRDLMVNELGWVSADTPGSADLVVSAQLIYHPAADNSMMATVWVEGPALSQPLHASSVAYCDAPRACDPSGLIPGLLRGMLLEGE